MRAIRSCLRPQTSKLIALNSSLSVSWMKKCMNTLKIAVVVESFRSWAVAPGSSPVGAA